MVNSVVKCRSCGAAIIWSETKNGRLIPLDAVSSLAGLFFVSPGGHAVHVDAKGEFAESCRANSSKRYTSHFATCPNAAEHRKP